MAFFAGSKFVKELTPKDFESDKIWKLKNKKCGMVLFYSRTCPHCVAVKEAYLKFASLAAFYNVMAFDCVAYPEYMNNIRTHMPSLIKSYPTFIIYKNGQPIESYEGERTPEAFTETVMRACRN